MKEIMSWSNEIDKWVRENMSLMNEIDKWANEMMSWVKEIGIKVKEICLHCQRTFSKIISIIALILIWHAIEI